MTIQVPARSNANVLIYHQVQNGVNGYIFQIPGAAPAFVEESDADRIARYMLFSNGGQKTTRLEELDTPGE